MHCAGCGGGGGADDVDVADAPSLFPQKSASDGWCRRRLTLSSASAVTLCTNASNAGYTPHANWKSCHTSTPNSARNKTPGTPRATDVSLRRGCGCGHEMTRRPAWSTRTVADVVEDVGLVDASAPKPDHVLVPIAEEREPRAVVVRRQSRQEVVRRDPVRT